MNKSIKYELEVLFAEWEARMKADDNTSHFTRDGLMYNSIPYEQSEDTWFSSSKRVLCLLKDQNQKGKEKWDEDIREWLTDTVNDKSESHLKIKEANRNLAPRFIRNLAYLLWGLSKADIDTPWWYDEVTKHFDEGCLKAVFRVYQMDYPDYEFYDTLCVSRRVLPDLENHQLQTVAAALWLLLRESSPRPC